MRRGAALLLALLAAGCFGLPGTPTPSASPAPTPPTPVPSNSTEGLALTGELSHAAIQPGAPATLRARLRNDGANATYATGGCGTRPFRFEVVAPNGTVVAPLPPDPRCLGPPDRDEPLPAGAYVERSLTWDGMRRWRDERLEVHEEPAAPGTYLLRASVDASREGRVLSPEVRLLLRVGAP